MDLITHSDNAKQLRAAFASLPINGESVPCKLFQMGINIHENDLMEPRKIDERWVPPKAGQFTELEASDEVWARPLGLGHVEKIDMGMLIYKINERLMDRFTKDLSIPVEFTPDIRFSNSTGAMLSNIRNIQSIINSSF